MKTHAERAETLFKSGYNCAQSLIGAFEGEIWIDFETSMKLGAHSKTRMAVFPVVSSEVSARITSTF